MTLKIVKSTLPPDGPAGELPAVALLKDAVRRAEARLFNECVVIALNRMDGQYDTALRATDMHYTDIIALLEIVKADVIAEMSRNADSDTDKRA